MRCYCCTQSIQSLRVPDHALYDPQAPICEQCLSQGTEFIAKKLLLRVVIQKQIMHAAAAEIVEQWTDHCDENGHGPTSLINYLTGMRMSNSQPYPPK